MDTTGDSHMKQIKLKTEDKYIFIFKHIYIYDLTYAYVC